jgi:hypothetical protein
MQSEDSDCVDTILTAHIVRGSLPVRGSRFQFQDNINLSTLDGQWPPFCCVYPISTQMTDTNRFGGHLLSDLGVHGLLVSVSEDDHPVAKRPTRPLGAR